MLNFNTWKPYNAFELTKVHSDGLCLYLKHEVKMSVYMKIDNSDNFHYLCEGVSVKILSWQTKKLYFSNENSLIWNKRLHFGPCVPSEDVKVREKSLSQAPSAGCKAFSPSNICHIWIPEEVTALTQILLVVNDPHVNSWIKKSKKTISRFYYWFICIKVQKNHK